MIETTTEPKATEQELALALEQAKRARIAEEAALAQSQQKTAEVLEERRQIAFSTHLRAEIAATGLKSYLSDEELKLVMGKEFKFNIGSNGSFSLTDERGRNVEFSAALTSLATAKRYLFDARTLQRFDRQQDQREMTRSDFPDTASKSAFIGKHGLAAWEAMKQHPSPSAGNVATMTAAQYKRLGLSERSRIAAEYGSDFIAEILSRR